MVFAKPNKTTNSREKVKESVMHSIDYVLNKAEPIPSNIMFDRRVVRGNTYAPRIYTTERSSLLNKPTLSNHKPLKQYAIHPLLKQSPCSQRPELQSKVSWRRSGMTTPEPVEGRLNLETQTDEYLEELAGEYEELEHSTQTEAFLDRPLTPFFIPQKLGIDSSTQVEPGETFDFDFEVQPTVEAIVGKVLEQSSAEIIEELELAMLESRHNAFQQRRAEDLAKTQELEAIERRLLEEKERRLKQAEECKKRDFEIRRRVAAQTYARGYLNGIVRNVFHELEAKGVFRDPVETEVKDEFIPWLVQTTEHQIKQCLCVKHVMEWIVKRALERRKERSLQALEKHKRDVEQQRLKQEEEEQVVLEEERRFKEELMKNATALLALSDPPLTTPETIEETKQTLLQRMKEQDEDTQEEEPVIPDEDVILELVRSGAITEEAILSAISNLQ